MKQSKEKLTVSLGDFSDVRTRLALIRGSLLDLQKKVEAKVDEQVAKDLTVQKRCPTCGK